MSSVIFLTKITLATMQLCSRPSAIENSKKKPCKKSLRSDLRTTKNFSSAREKYSRTSFRARTSLLSLTKNVFPKRLSRRRARRKKQPEFTRMMACPKPLSRLQLRMPKSARNKLETRSTTLKATSTLD